MIGQVKRGQNEILSQLEKVLQGNENRTEKIVKPEKVPVWTQKMELETWKKTLEVWIQQKREFGENVRFHKVMESLKVNKEVIGLAEYVATYVLPVLDTVEKQTVQQIMDKLEERYGKTRLEQVEEMVMEWMQFKPDDYEKAEDYWFRMERMYSRMEEKKVD